MHGVGPNGREPPMLSYHFILVSSATVNKNVEEKNLCSRQQEMRLSFNRLLYFMLTKTFTFC